MNKNICVVGTNEIGTGLIARFIASGISLHIVADENDKSEIISNQVDMASQSYEQLLTIPICKRGKLHYYNDTNQLPKQIDFIFDCQELAIKERIAVCDKIISNCENEPLVMLVSYGNNYQNEIAEYSAPEKLVSILLHSPVYLIPLVEFAFNNKFSEHNKDILSNFFIAIGMHPIFSHSSKLDFQSFQQTITMVLSGINLIANREDIIPRADEALNFGPGLSLGILGPLLNFQLQTGETSIDKWFSMFDKKLDTHFQNTYGRTISNDEKKQIQEIISSTTSGVNTETLCKLRNSALIEKLKTLRRIRYGAGNSAKQFEAFMLSQTQADNDKRNIWNFHTVHLQTISNSNIDRWGIIYPEIVIEWCIKASKYLLNKLNADNEYFESGYGFRQEKVSITNHGKIKAEDRISVQAKIEPWDKTENLIMSYELKKDDLLISEVSIIFKHWSFYDNDTCSPIGKVKNILNQNVIS